MLEGRVDDQMIEIGDPTEESSALDPDPRVVIEYHERGGVPWMLIPPLLVLSAVGAILLHNKLAPRPLTHSNPPASLVRAADVDNPAIEAKPPAPAVEPPAGPVVQAEPTAKPEPKAEEPTPPVAPPSPPVEPRDGLPSISAETATEPVSVAELAPPPPRARGLGFDPRALEADRDAEPRADPALAPAAREGRPDDRDQPREVAPDLLPPDPREARLRQEQRRLEMSRRVEAERVRYHADLKVICRKLRTDSAPAILELNKNYDVKIDPQAAKSAKEMLGPNGKFAGADRVTRIELLRRLGFPEPAIVGDLYDNFEKAQIGRRDGPRDVEDAFYFAALFLLRNPPRPLPARSGVVRPSGDRAGRDGPPATPFVGNGTSPAR